MNCAALRRRRRPVDARSHERVAERHSLPDREQPVCLGRARRRCRDSESLGRAPDQQSVAGRLRRRDEQQLPRLLGQRLETPQKALLDPPGQPGAPTESEAARQLRRGESPRAARAAQAGCPASRPRSGHATAFIEQTRTAELNSARASPSPKPTKRKLWQAAKLLAPARARRTPARPARRAAGARRTQHLRGCVIQPLGIVHDANRAAPPRLPTSSVSTASPTRNRSGAGPPLTPNDRRSASRCGAGSRSRWFEHRRAELVQRRERQLHLGLDPDSARDPQVRSVPGRRTPGAPSCRRRPRLAQSACRSVPRERTRASDRAGRTRHRARACSSPTPSR